jgi:ParB/RepB/Spo0J family partition protein
MNVQQVKIDLIDPQPWNSRLPKWGAALAKDLQDFEYLKSSMDTTKGGRQIEPIVVHVQQETGRYTLGIGSRRLKAAQELEWETIAADVRTEPPSDEDNMVENMRRADLSTYEQARACFHFREQGKSIAETAAIVGIAESTLRNYVIMVRDLAAPIVQDWEQELPAVNLEFLRTLATKKHYPTQDDQLKAWEARKAAVARVEETGEGSIKTRERQTRPPKEERLPIDQERLRSVLLALESKKTPEKMGGTKTWLLQLFTFLGGVGRDAPRDMLQALQALQAQVKETIAPKGKTKAAKGKKK